MQIVSRADAKLSGLKRFFTGVPCQRGHVSERTVLRNDCVKCLHARQAAWNNKNAVSVNARSQKWYAANKEKAKSTRSKWRELNADKDLADIARYQKENSEKLRAASEIWRKANPDKVTARYARYRERNKESILLAGYKWRSRNKDKVNAKKSRRIASKLLATPTWADLNKIAEFYKLASLNPGLHVDHIVPIRSGMVCGLHCEHNLQVIPGLKNQSKSNRYWPDMP